VEFSKGRTREEKTGSYPYGELVRKSVLEPFGRELAEQFPDIEVIHIVDDSLCKELLPDGSPTPAVIRRIILYVAASQCGRRAGGALSPKC
jgi:hypothetical protein